MGGRGRETGFIGTIQKIEKRISGDKVETAYLLDKSENVVFSKTDNATDYVCFTNEQVNSMRGNILTHNHPSGSTFSKEDVELLVTSGLKEIRAAGKNGTFSLMKIEENINADHFYRSYENAIKTIRVIMDMEYETAKNQYNAGNISVYEFEEKCQALNNKLNESRKEWLANHSRNFGYAFNYETIKK